MFMGGQPNRSAQRSKNVSFQPPTKGWIARANIRNGIPGTALTLDNFFPLADAVKLREGFDEHSDTAESTDVESLLVYHGISGTNKLFAATGTKIFDVTGAASSVVTSMTNARWQSVNFATSGGNFLIAVNGADVARSYNGSTWSTAVTTGTTSDAFIDIAEYKSRLFFAVVDTLKFAYLATESISGAASTFELGSLFNKGGYLLAIDTLTRDGGAGPDDNIVFVTSEGQVAVYQGSDPSDPNDWALIGVYSLPRPVGGRRCLFKVGADLYMISESGVIPISKALAVAEASVGTVAVTNNIDQEVTKSSKLYKGNYGWEIAEWSQGTMAILNVPISANVSHQYVMNTQTGAWCRFTGIAAKCWAVLGGALYFGGKTGKVYQFGENASDAGTPITGDLKTHFDSFGNVARLKNWLMVRPIILSDGTTTPSIGLNVDFSDAAPTSQIVTANTDLDVYGTAVYGTATYASGRQTYSQWSNVSDNPGYQAAVRMRAQARGSGAPVLLQVNGFDVLYESGGVF